MKVCVNTRILSSHLTGVQRYALEILSRLVDRVDRVSPAVPMAGIRGHVWEQVVLPLRLQGRVLFSPSNTGPIAIRRQVVSLHDVVALDHPEWLNPRFSAWYRFLTPRLASRVAHVITISDFSKQRLLAHARVSEDRISVIHNGVDARFRPMDETELSVSLGRLSLPSRRYVLCVGSLEPRKNLSRLLLAWSRVINEIPEDVWLVVAGKRGTERVFARSAGLASVPPRVHFTGHVADDVLPGLYAGALVFAYPSLYEGFGLPPLEAMASGVPVLTGNRASLPEVVGDAGVMVDPYDVDALGDGLKRLVEDGVMRDGLRIAGLARAKKFSWEGTTERTWAVLEGIAGD